MKLLGKLNARSLMVGDKIEMAGFLSVVTSVSVMGMGVVIETDKLHHFKLCCIEKIKVYSALN